MPTPLRLGLIGAGRWGKVYLRTLAGLSDRCRLTHLCTRDPRNAALVPYPVTVVNEWRALIRAACDAVIIASPTPMHPEMVEACVSAGKPCLVEKPLCCDLATAERLHERVQAAGVPVLVNHIHLFNDVYRALKQAIDREGEPVRMILAEGMGLGPFRTDTPALWDWAPHDVSVCFDLLGQAPSRADALAGPCGQDGTPELVSLRLDFSDGACAWIHAGRLSPWRRRTLSVYTDHRLYVWDEFAPEPLSLLPFDSAARAGADRPETLTRTPLVWTSAGSPMEHLLTSFVRGLSGGERRHFGTAMALEVTRWISACERAMDARRTHP